VESYWRKGQGIVIRVLPKGDPADRAAPEHDSLTVAKVKEALKQLSPEGR
jgi:hypothetical protein